LKIISDVYDEKHEKLAEEYKNKELSKQQKEALLEDPTVYIDTCIKGIKKGLMEDLLTGRVRVNKLIKEEEK